MKAKGALCFHGVPTKVDVERLVASYGVPAEGIELTLAELAHTLGMQATSYRFKTVVSAWRKMLFREHNVLLVGTGDKSLACADPETRIRTAVGKIVRGRKSIGRGVVIAYQTDEKRLSKDNGEVRNRLIGLNQKKLELALKVT